MAQTDSLNIVESEDISNWDLMLFSDHLQDLKNHPLDINHARIEEFRLSGLFTEIQIKKLLKYRLEYNGFLEVDELKSLQGFDVDFVNRVKSYLTTKSVESRVFNYSNASVLIRMSTNNVGLDDYIGTNTQYLTRVKYASESCNAGLVVEKDRGERFYSQYGVAYLSGYLQYKTQQKYFNQVIVGDYNLQFGEGLLFGSAYSMGKSYNSTALKKIGKEVIPHSSANEFLKLRGVVTRYQSNKTSIIGFVSAQNRSATINDDTSFGALKQDGLFTSNNDLEKVNVLQERVLGVRVKSSYKLFLFGGTFVFIDYNGILNKKESLSNQFDFRGRQFSSGSFDYQYNGKHAYSFGEASYHNGGFSVITNNLWVIGQNEVIFSLRRYAIENDFLFSNPMSERSSAKNENAVYVGVKKPLRSNLLWNTYVDIYQYPWVTTTLRGVNYGKDLVSFLQYYPKPNWELQLRNKYEEKYENSGIRSVGRIRLVSINEIGRAIRFKTSVEQQNVLGKSHDRAFLFGENVKFYLRKWGVSFIAGVVVYDSKTFDSGVYYYENDVRYAFTVPRFYGRGERLYFVATKRVLKHYSLSIKYGENIKKGELTKIDFRCQLIASF